MERLLAWLKGFNPSTHTLALIAGALAAAYAEYPPFRDLVTSAYHHLSPTSQALIESSIFLFGLYKKGVKKGDTMPSDQVFCPRCGKLGVAVETATDRLVYCPASHGLIHKSPLPAQPAAVATEAEAEASKGRPLNGPEAAAWALPQPSDQPREFMSSPVGEHAPRAKALN